MSHIHALPLVCLSATELGGFKTDGTPGTVIGNTVVKPKEPWPPSHGREEAEGHPALLTNRMWSQRMTCGPQSRCRKTATSEGCHAVDDLGNAASDVAAETLALRLVFGFDPAVFASGSLIVLHLSLAHAPYINSPRSLFES